MNSPTYTVLDLAEFAHGPDVIHTQARALLIAASALIQRGWCRYHRALSAQGRPVAPDDDQAAYFSLSGSLIAHRELNAHTIHPDALYAALRAIYHTLHEKPPQSTDHLYHRVDAFNDDQAQDRDEVLDRIRQALAGYDALVRGDGRFCPPQYPKADGEALHYIERIEQSVIPGPCSQRRPHPMIGA